MLIIIVEICLGNLFTAKYSSVSYNNLLRNILTLNIRDSGSFWQVTLLLAM